MNPDIDAEERRAKEYIQMKIKCDRYEKVLKEIYRAPTDMKRTVEMIRIALYEEV